MKFTSIILGLFAGFLAQSSVALEKTQQEAHKFLIDGGQVSADSEVETFAIDRQGQIRIRLIENNFVLSFGLEEDQDTYSIAFMSKKKQNPNRNPQGSTTEADELTNKIGESLSILKGGKVVQVTRPSNRNRNEIEIEYKLGAKAYLITGNYNHKNGQLLIHKVQDAVKSTNTEL